MREHNDSAKTQNDVNFIAACTLCRSGAELFAEISGKRYYRCGQCSAIFLEAACYVSKEDERKRYLKHNNNVEDPGYQEFVKPIVSRILKMFGKEHHGLDFGSGAGPVISKLLREKGYSVELYDPIFWNTPGSLEKKYDFIACCEVMEHFHSPEKEFKLLRSLLKPKGILFCMTELYSETTDFKKWRYRNDPTHVLFYHRNTLMRIKTQFGFSSMENDGRLTQFSA